MSDFLLRHCRPSGARLPLLGAAALAVSVGVCSVLDAAPVTFAFEAEISSVSLGNPFASEIDPVIGDVITGQFTFEPNAGDGTSPFELIQLHAFSLDINGLALSSAAFMTTSRDDSYVDVDCTDLLCPGFAISDRLSLGGANLMEMSSPIFSNLDQTSSGFQMDLEEWFGHPFWGGMDVLDTARIPTNIETWNQFSGRSLKVWLGDGQGGSLSMNATVGQFTVVPEPASFTLILLVFVAGFANASPRRRT